MSSSRPFPLKALFLRFFPPTVLLLLLLPLLSPGRDLVSAEPKPRTAANAALPGASRPNFLVLHVYFGNQAERDRLATELDAVEASTSDGYLTVLADRATLASLRGRGLRVEIDSIQTANVNSPVKFGNTTDNFYGGYHTVEEMQQFMDQEAAAYPDLAEKVSVGQSWCRTHPGQCTQPNTWNGYDLYAMHITNRNIPGPKPVFWVNSGIHAQEIAPAELALDFIDYLLSGYATNADSHWMIDYHDIWVMLPNNPDGHHIVESGGNNPVMWRKNANNSNGCTTYPSFGTDLNRNFPFQWNCCGGSSGDPCNQAYHGSSPGSDEETRAVFNKISELIPDQRGPDLNDPAPITTTGTFIDLHSFSPVNLWPWSMSASPPPNNSDLKNLTFHFSSTNADPPGNDTTPCQFGDCLYIADGTTNDWVYGELGAAAFAAEIGEVFFPTYTETQTILWPQNRGMLLYLAKVARMPYLMTRGPDTTLVATDPMTVTQGAISQLTGTINYAWDYHETYNAYIQNVATAEYYIDTPPWAGGTPIPMQAVDGSFDSPVEAVQAAVQTSGLSVGRHILFVRGRGVNDYEGLHSWGPASAAWLVVQPYASPTPSFTGTPATATRTRTLTPTPTPTNTPCSDPAILNGGFETGAFSPGWTILDSIATPTVRNTRNHGGGYAAFLGSFPGYEPRGDSSIYQRFTVPSSGGTLSFWYYGFTRDHINFDWQDAYITDLNGTILATIMHVCDGSERWTNITYDLSAFAGQTIRVEFLVHQDGAGDVANMYIDDVMLLESCLTPTVTRTSTPGPTATVCTIEFTDVHPQDYFYEAVNYLYCHGVISGYGDGTFRPYSNTTRGQMSKIVVLGFTIPIWTPDPANPPTFTDVPRSNAFFPFVETAAHNSIVSGYSDGTFRPFNDVTRGQLSKIVVIGASTVNHWPLLNPNTATFNDVPRNNPFYTYIETAYCHQIISGYSDGTFRPGNNATRGQISKIEHLAILDQATCVAPATAAQAR